MQYRIVREKDFTNGFWWAEEKTSFGWERIHGTTGADAAEAEKLYRELKEK